MTNYKKIKTLYEVAGLIKQWQILGNKLIYFCNNYYPYRVSTQSMTNQNYTLDLLASQGNNYMLGFDNGDYLFIDCYGDCQLTLWITKDINDNRCFGPDNGFSLDKFFDDCIGQTLVDVDVLIDDYWPYDEGGMLYDDGDIYFVGQIKLIFDNDKSLVIGGVEGSTYIKQLDCYDNVDTCNIWHIKKCDNIGHIYFDCLPDDQNDQNQLPYYAKLICDMVNRRDCLDEIYVLSHITTIQGMFDVLDHIVQLQGCIKADEVMMYIDQITQV